MKTLFYCAIAGLFTLIACNSNQETADTTNDTASDTPAVLETNDVEMMTAVEGTVYTVGFYNVENLFDTKDDPKTSDEDFLPTNSERPWTEERYQNKLKNLAEVISKLGDEDGPELLGVCEVENKEVLEALVAEEAIKGRNYGIVHFESADGRGIDNALLYKKDYFKVEKATNYVINFPMEPDYDTRDIVLVQGSFMGERLSLLVNHWPSRRGGEKESEPRRVLVATKVRQVVDQLLEKDPKANIIIMGDFNDETDNKSIKEVLMAKGEGFDPSAGELFNTLAALDAKNIGSYKYRDNWNMLDQIIISGNLTDSQGWDYKASSATIFSPEWLKQQTPQKYKGSPLRTFGGRKYLGGYSDHFPVYIHLMKGK